MAGCQDVDNYNVVSEDNVYANVAMESSSVIAYADLVFDPGSFGSCHKAFCVFENQGDAQEILISPKNHIYANQCEVEHVILISEDENSDLSSDSDESCHSYLEIDDYEKHLHPCNFGDGPSNRTTVQSTLSVKHGPKEATTLTCSGMTVLFDQRIVIVTTNGEVLVFGPKGSFLFLRDFPEHFENVTTFADSTIAATSGFSVRFYKIFQSDVSELKEKCLDFECNAFMTVHGIDYNSKEFIVSCNLQSVNPKPFIRLLDKRGKITKTVELPELISPVHVASSLDRKLFFVSDPKLKTLFALNRDGKIQWKREDEDTPTSLTNIPKHTLVVACQKSCSLKMYSYQGTLRRVVVAGCHLDRYPINLAYQTRSELLLICSERNVVGKEDFIYFLKLKSSKKKKLEVFTASEQGRNNREKRRTMITRPLLN